jgi:hypothetical protein
MSTHPTDEQFSQYTGLGPISGARPPSPNLRCPPPDNSQKFKQSNGIDPIATKSVRFQEPGPTGSVYGISKNNLANKFDVATHAMFNYVSKLIDQVMAMTTLGRKDDTLMISRSTWQLLGSYGELMHTGPYASTPARPLDNELIVIVGTVVPLPDGSKAHELRDLIQKAFITKFQAQILELVNEKTARFITAYDRAIKDFKPEQGWIVLIGMKLDDLTQEIYKDLTEKSATVGTYNGHLAIAWTGV